MHDVTISDANLDRPADAEADRLPGDPTQLEIRLACLELQRQRGKRAWHLRKQVARWRWQAPHCPADLSRLIRGET